jgi:hypothetical protein
MKIVAVAASFKPRRHPRAREIMKRLDKASAEAAMTKPLKLRQNGALRR